MRVLSSIFVVFFVAACSSSSSPDQPKAKANPTIADAPPITIGTSASSEVPKTTVAQANSPAAPTSEGPRVIIPQTSASSNTPGVTVTIEQTDPNNPSTSSNRTSADKPKTKVEGNELDESNPAFDIVPIAFNAGCGPDQAGAKLKLKKGTWRSTENNTYTAEVLDGRQTIDSSIGPITIVGTVEIKDLPVQYLEGVSLKRLTQATLAPQKIALEPKTSDLLKKSQEGANSTKREQIEISGGTMSFRPYAGAMLAWMNDLDLTLEKPATILMSRDEALYPDQALTVQSKLKIRLDCNVQGLPPTKAVFTNLVLRTEIGGDQWFNIASLNYKLRSGTEIHFTTLRLDDYWKPLTVCPLSIETAKVEPSEMGLNNLALPPGKYHVAGSLADIPARGERRCWPEELNLKLDAPLVTDLGNSVFPEHAQVDSIVDGFSRRKGQTYPNHGTLAQPAKLVFEGMGAIQASGQFDSNYDARRGAFVKLVPPQTISIDYQDGTKTETQQIQIRGDALYMQQQTDPKEITMMIDYNPNLYWYSNLRKPVAPYRWGKMETAGTAAKSKSCVVTFAKTETGYNLVRYGYRYDYYDNEQKIKEDQSLSAAQKWCGTDAEKLVQKFINSVRGGRTEN